MRKNPARFLVSTLALLVVFVPRPCIPDEGEERKREKRAAENLRLLPATVEEARGRARLLHEMVHGALQVMHRDYFGDGEDQDLNLPSQSLEDVFLELERSHHVKLHWLAVNAKVMDSDHEAEDRFEERVVEEFSKGDEDELELVTEKAYRRAGRIRLRNSCLKCHVPNRKTLEDRSAALVITIPMRKRAADGVSPP